MDDGRWVSERMKGTSFRWLAVLVGLVVGLAPVGAFAHAGNPVQTTTVQAGPYTLDVMLYSEPRVSQPISVRIAPHSLPGERPNLRVQVEMQPGLGTDATPVKARVYPDPDNPAMYATYPVVVVRGSWVLELTVLGPRGSGAATVPLTVAAPAAIPLWLGWLLGLSPLLGIAWFAWWQGRWLKNYR